MSASQDIATAVAAIEAATATLNTVATQIGGLTVPAQPDTSGLAPATAALTTAATSVQTAVTNLATQLTPAA